MSAKVRMTHFSHGIVQATDAILSSYPESPVTSWPGTKLRPPHVGGQAQEVRAKTAPFGRSQDATRPGIWETRKRESKPRLHNVPARFCAGMTQ
jgi:hypothetical protein